MMAFFLWSWPAEHYACLSEILLIHELTPPPPPSPSLWFLSYDILKTLPVDVIAISRYNLGPLIPNACMKTHLHNKGRFYCCNVNGRAIDSGHLKWGREGWEWGGLG